MMGGKFIDGPIWNNSTDISDFSFEIANSYNQLDLMLRKSLLRRQCISQA